MTTILFFSLIFNLTSLQLPKEFRSKYSVIILDQKVEIIPADANGIPIVFATYMGIGANEDFLDLPKWVQETLILHELGHIELDHIRLERYFDRSTYWDLFHSVDPWEIEADLYSANKSSVWQVIAMLLYVKDICDDIHADYCSYEVGARINSLLYGVCE